MRDCLPVDQLVRDLPSKDTIILALGVVDAHTDHHRVENVISFEPFLQLCSQQSNVNIRAPVTHRVTSENELNVVLQNFLGISLLIGVDDHPSI